MDAPRCRVCEKRHYGVCAQVNTAPPKVNTEVNEVNEVNEPDPVTSEVNAKVNVPDVNLTDYQGRDLEKRRGYMRDYMRKRRG